ncbi:MAG: hypothetical protein H6974_00060 [Gammaproteobacteria bacterium]|nr:hypothetical protein [Gammaproteobacteria bacterium]
MNNTELLDPTELVSRIREAVGDKDSLLTQQELIRHCKRLYDGRQFYIRRFDKLQKAQKRMREPERTMVCDILANGSLLYDPSGSRYNTH